MRTVIAITAVRNPGKILSDILNVKAEYLISEQWIRYAFWKEAELFGLFMSLKASLGRISSDDAEEEVNHNSIGTLYLFSGTVDEFLARFCRVPMMSNTVKRCPNSECGEYFVSPPSEFLKHVIRCTQTIEAAKRKPLIVDGDHDDCCVSCC